MARMYRHWSRDAVIREIRNLHSQGVTLNSGYIARTNPGLAYAGRKYLGSWEAAVQAAGFDYSEIRIKNRWNRDRIAAQIRELRQQGRPLNVSAAEREYGGLVGAAISYFGSWGKAIEAAGLVYSDVKLQKEWSKREIVKEIRRLHAQGFDLSKTIPVREKYRILHAASVRYFGSWAEAMKAARLERLLRRGRGSRPRLGTALTIGQNAH